MKVATSSPCPKISRVEFTDDTLSSPGGLFFFGRYLENTGFLRMVEPHLADLRKSCKGRKAEKLVKQILCAFADGRGGSMEDFSVLRRDPAQADILELAPEEMAGADMMKRFFRKFKGRKWARLRKVLQQVFLWRLSVEHPQVVVLDLDTMVLDNDDALKREGCHPTYKKVKGFQNLQLSWDGRLVDVVFRSGEKHSNHGQDVLRTLRKTVAAIRGTYDAEVPIVVTMDSGFLDGKILTAMEEELGIFYVCSGKLYESITKHVASVPQEAFRHIRKGRKCWAYVEFESGLGAWKATKRRTVYTTLVEEDGQLSMPFSRPDAVYYTNLGRQEELDKELWNRGFHRMRSVEGILELAHGRGKSELIHRSIKEFMGREHLPFNRNFGMNAAYYLFQALGHFLFECYRRDVAVEVVPQMSYPETIRRKVLDFAAKVVRTGNRVILKVTRSIWHSLAVERLWERCQAAPVMAT